MKKIYAMLAASLVVGTSAMAASTSPEVVNKLQFAKQNFNEVKFLQESNIACYKNQFRTRATDSVGDVTVTSPLKNFSIGFSPAGRAYTNPIGFLPSFGTVKFTASAALAKSYEWTWNNGSEETDPNYKSFTANTAVNEITLNPGEVIYGLTVTAQNGEAATVGTPMSSLYLVGCRPASHGFKTGDETVFGLHINPCGSGIVRESFMAYGKHSSMKANYDSITGAFKNWPKSIASIKKQGEASDYTNIKIKSFSHIIPAQSSAYFFNEMYACLRYAANESTTLDGHIYEVINNVVQQKPIARITAKIDAAIDPTTDMVTFDVIPVDADGDDVEGDLVIDNKDICISIENFDENEAITCLHTIYGSKTNFPKTGRSPFYTNSYISLEYTYGGNTGGIFTSCPVYYSGDDENSFWDPTNYEWSINAVFPYVVNEEGKRDFNVTVPAAGGDANINVSAFYFNLKSLLEAGMMEAESDSEWLTFSVGVASTETYLAPITVTATALPQGTASRKGSIKFTGQAQDFTVTVTQGESGIADITVEGNAKYFDLQGRQINGNPEKGVYLVKSGNKVTKVIR